MNGPVTAAETAVIFDVQRFSVHDGPGIRTLVFFKGCSLECAWCQNPEAIRANPELAFYADRCIECGQTVEICPEAAIVEGPPRAIDWTRCTDCGACVPVCPAEAFSIVGKRYAVDDLVEVCLRDRDFYAASGGGVTLSGGEPILQHRFLQAFLPALEAHDIHVVLETAGHYSFERLEPLLPHLDRIFFDLKLGSAERHRCYTGRSNDRIVANLARLLSLEVPVTVRIPMVPGINTEDAQVADLCRTLLGLGVTEAVLLEYNALWESKLARLRSGRSPLGITGRDADYATVAAAFASRGISTRPIN